jgi:DNA-binding NarL/FixJ family response regulator
VYQDHYYLSRKISDTLIDEYVRTGTAPEFPNPISRLSHRERQVLSLIADGKSNTKIAETLALSTKTVETYRSRLMHKLEITDLATLVKLAIRHGMTSLD